MTGVYRKYRNHRFTADSRVLLKKAIPICDSYAAQGLKLTLRQLYYQLVAGDIIPNEDAQYKRLGKIVTKARESGLMSWTAIEDRGRNCYGPSPVEEVDEVLNGIEFGLDLDRWKDQEYYVEVWVEKQALESIVSRACNPLYTPYMACKGYLSATEAWQAGLRFKNALANGKQPVLVHLGDHDPSGIDMTRDNGFRVGLFAEDLGLDIKVDRIALNMPQIEELKPPPNPAKMTDSRFKTYVEEYGQSSWELDALPPAYLDDLIKSTIKGYVDQDKWDKVDELEEEMREPLAALGDNWPAVEQFLRDKGLC